MGGFPRFTTYVLLYRARSVKRRNLIGVCTHPDPCVGVREDICPYSLPEGNEQGRICNIPHRGRDAIAIRISMKGKYPICTAFMHKNNALSEGVPLRALVGS